MSKFLKYIALAFALLFIWAAYVQFNDPDAALWVGLYLVAALGAFLLGMGKVPNWVGFLLAVAYGVLAILSWPETYEGVQIGEGDINNIERGRESLGMAITALLFLVLGFFRK